MNFLLVLFQIKNNHYRSRMYNVASVCPFFPPCWHHSTPALLNSSRPQGWVSIPALGFSTPFGIKKLVRTILTRLNLPHSSSRDPVLLLLAGVICCSYLQCSRDFFFFFPLWFSGWFSLCWLPSKPRGVGGCEQSEITVLHQAISPFTLFTSIGNEKQGKKKGREGRERKMGNEEEGRWEQQRPRERNRGERRRGEEGTEWCYLYEADEWNLYLW